MKSLKIIIVAVLVAISFCCCSLIPENNEVERIEQEENDTHSPELIDVKEAEEGEVSEEKFTKFFEIKDVKDGDVTTFADGYENSNLTIKRVANTEGYVEYHFSDSQKELFSVKNEIENLNQNVEYMSEHYVSVPEQGGGNLIPEGMLNPGQVYTVSNGKSDMIGVFRLESQMLPGNGKFDRTGLGTDRECKEAVDTAFNFLKANGNRISGSLGVLNKDFVINYQDLQGIGMTKTLALPTLIALCSIALGRPVQSSMVVIGDFSIGGTIMKAENLASTLQVCLDSGAKKVLLPQTYKEFENL